MSTFSIANGSSTTFTDTTPGDGIIIDFDSLDNSFNIQINGVDLFVGGPSGSENELQFQTDGTDGQTVRFADGDLYGSDTDQIWQLGNTNGEPVVRLQINPDGTIELSGVKVDNGSLETLELFNGLSVNTAAIAAAWNDTGSNTIVLDQIVTGPTDATGEVEDVPCFSSGTLIKTTLGSIRVEDLKVGDKVLTLDLGYQSIRWIGSSRVSQAQLEARSNLKPIIIQADALGAGFPEHDLIVSQQHRILISSTIAMRMFGRNQILVPAKKLLSLGGIDIQHNNPNGVEYWHFLFDGHQVIWSNGALTESLFTGPEALKAISSEGLVEIQTLFPEICDPGFEPTAARYIPKKGKLMEKLAHRHKANNKPLFSPLN